jgi:hypothetical protein
MPSYGHVFISYAHEDSQQAYLLHQNLEASGFPAWIDGREIRAGAVFTRRLEEGIVTAAAVTVVLTDASSRSEWVEREVTFSISRSVPVIPLCFADVAAPITLAGLQSINFQSSYASGIDALCRRLRQLLSDRLATLIETRKALLGTQQSSLHPERFQGTIEELTEQIGGWQDRMARQNERVLTGMQLERKRVVEEINALRASAVQRIVGYRPPDAGDYFKNRVSKLNELGRLLERAATPIITVTGRSGIGKSALASKVLGSLEKNQWPHIANGPHIDGLAYLTANISPGVSLEQIFLSFSRLLGDVSLEATWTSTSMALDE